MSSRPAEHLILAGGVYVSARVCAYLNRYANLEAFRLGHRGTDPEVDNTLVAFRMAELHWRGTATGTRTAAEPELARTSEWLSTTQAEVHLRIGARAIRKALTEGRLQGEQVAGRWRVSREAIAHYKAKKTE